MDYPKSDPTARLLNDKFTDGDPVNGVPASRDSANYQNAVYEEIINAIVVGGLVPDESLTNQLAQVIVKALTASSARVGGISVTTVEEV